MRIENGWGSEEDYANIECQTHEMINNMHSLDNHPLKKLFKDFAQQQKMTQVELHALKSDVLETILPEKKK